MHKLKIVYFILLLLISYTSISQIRGDQIEIKPYIRIDKYPEFFFNYMGRFSTDYLTMQGTSYGIDLSYKIATKKKINYKVGLGYLRYSFNKLKKINSVFGPSDSRPIDYRGFNDRLYHSNKYFYNIIPLNIGIEKVFLLKPKLNMVSGIEINNYYTFSQAYNIENVNKTTYKVNDNSLFGHSFQLYLGILRQYKKSSFAPLLSVPIYTIWQKDDVFAENEKEKRKKWFNGFSIGFQYNFSIKN